MAQSRYIPYGYVIAEGEIKINDSEAEVVRHVFKQYGQGLSYKQIADGLTELGIAYSDANLSWNKSVVFRMLQNENYLGNEKYPAIVDVETFEIMQKAQKRYTKTESRDIKELKSLLTCAQCGSPVKRRMKNSGAERWHCPADLNHVSITLTDDSLIQQITSLQKTLSDVGEELQAQSSIEVIRLQNEVDRIISQDEIDTEKASAIIYRLAEEKYNASVEPNHRKRDVIKRLRESDRLNVKLLKDVVTAIKISGDRVTELVQSME